MSIRKLWNVLRGRTENQSDHVGNHTAVRSTTAIASASQPPKNASSAAAMQPLPAAASSTSVKKAKQDRARKCTPPVATAPPETAKQRRVEPVKPRGIFGRSQLTPEQKSLQKLLKNRPAVSVLELGVGDGSRAPVILESLQSLSPDAEIRYVAVDEFEMADGPIKMKDFHQRLRSLNVHPQIFPEPVARGMIRVAHTVGAVDLVLIGIDQNHWQGTDCQSLLAKVTHTESTILMLVDGQWAAAEKVSSVIPATDRSIRRAA